MTSRKLTVLIGALLCSIPLAGCVSDADSDADGDEEEEVYGTHADNVSSSAPIFVMRHGETFDGKNITAAGKKAIEDGLAGVSCDDVKKAFVVRLKSATDLDGNKRYTATAKIVADKLNALCPSADVVKKIRMVRDLSDFTATEAQDLFDAMTSNHSQPRIYILGSFVLHKLTADTDCTSGNAGSCYFKSYGGFMDRWNATRALDTCEIGQDPDDRRFMYNWMYMVESKKCTDPNRIPLSSYPLDKCWDQWADVYTVPSGCHF